MPFFHYTRCRTDFNRNIQQGPGTAPRVGGDWTRGRNERQPDRRCLL